LDTQFFLKIKEFILFESLIAEDVLTVLYVICAITLPFAAWFFLMWVVRRYAVVIRFYKAGNYSIIFSLIMWVIRKIKFFQNKIDEKIRWQAFTWTQKLKFITIFIIMTGFAELFMRLLFEYLIAYMHMHDALIVDSSTI
jgi:hypothetical protein